MLIKPNGPLKTCIEADMLLTSNRQKGKKVWSFLKRILYYRNPVL